MKTLSGSILLVSLIALVGCAQLNKQGTYGGDYVLYHADQTIVTSFEILDTFLRWEYENREALKEMPEIKEGANAIRAEARFALEQAILFRDLYALSKTDENKSKLTKATDALELLLTMATKYIETKETK